MGIIDINQLIVSIQPKVSPGVFVFCTLKSSSIADVMALNPKGVFSEVEGLTLIIDKNVAIKNNLSFSGEFCQITLTVHSSLEAVGLTAAISAALASAGVSANMVAAYYHDHIFVPQKNTSIALKALQDLQKSCQEKLLY